MTRRLLALALAAALFAAAQSGVHAKAPSLIITGGELGQYAAFFGPGESGWAWLPGEQAQTVKPPTILPGPSYDLYQPQWLFAAAQAAASGQAGARYYPEAGLIHDSATNGWYKPSPETLGSLRTAIDSALLRKAAGDLALGVAAAELRGWRLTDATFWLRPIEDVSVADFTIAPLSTCETCAVLATGPEDFAMRHLLPMISRPPEEGAAGTPKLLIEYAGGSASGLVGAYAPPGDGRPGRFWPGLFSPEAAAHMLSYPTAPAFDRAMAEALGGPGDGSLTPLALVVAGGVVLAGLVLIGIAKTDPRRRAGHGTAGQSLG